jgi:sialate O-acetylesterase
LALCAVRGVLAEGADNPIPDPVLAIQCGLPFQDNAILQQKIPLPVWGTSLPGAGITVVFGAQTKATVAGADGKWRVVLDPLTAVKLKSVNDSPEGETMTITCETDGKKAVKTIRNILVGEVWLCSGQSNMAGKMGSGGSGRLVAEDPAARDNYPSLRQLVSPTESWLICTPQTVSGFKRVCYFFATGLQREALVPVGVINAAVGGSRIETWLNQEPFGRGGNYTQMIEPLVGFGIRGVVWYQGESNEKDRRGYLPKLSSLITGWRAAWNQPDSQAGEGPRGDFSFYYVQLPGIGTSSTNNPAGGDGRAEIRQACVDALAITNTGLAVTIDVGALGEHPPNKYDTGVRLARLALHNDYGFKDLAVCTLYKSHKIEGPSAGSGQGSIRIFFDHAQGGLMVARKEGVQPPKPTPDAKPQWLSIQDKDGTWHWADGRIEGSELVVSCKDVKEPIAVRYAYTQHPLGNILYNKEGQPVGPFTTCGYDPAPADVPAGPRGR